MKDYPLFEMYPGLAERVRRVVLGKFPTPVELMQKLGQSLDVKSLWVKRDDLDSDEFSGNKVRVMELLMGRAQQKGCDILISMGALGSNQILSSIVFGRKLGFDIEGVYFEQPLHGYVRRHLLIGKKLGASMYLCRSPNLTPFYVAYRWARNALSGRKPYFIPTFGSHPLCVLGYVNAGFELAQQIKTGLCPRPDAVYVTLGTGGTYAGILLAFHLLKLPIKVVGVRITDLLVANEYVVANILNRTVKFMRKNHADIPKIKFVPGELVIEHDFFGGEYAKATVEGEAAIQKVCAEEKLILDTTYTGKTMAALLNDAGKGKLHGMNVLFWHTLNRIDLRPQIFGLTPECLPPEIQNYATRCGDDHDEIGF